MKIISITTLSRGISMTEEIKYCKQCNEEALKSDDYTISVGSVIYCNINCHDLHTKSIFELICNNWHFDCSYCGNDIWDFDDDSGSALDIIYNDDDVFCGIDCFHYFNKGDIERRIKFQECVIKVKRKFNYITITNFEGLTSYVMTAKFTFPGAKRGGVLTVNYGSDKMVVTINPEDLEALERWKECEYNYTSYYKKYPRDEEASD